VAAEEHAQRPLTLKDLSAYDAKSSKSTQRASARKSVRNTNKSLDKELRDQQHLLKSFLTNMQSPKSQMNTNRQAQKVDS
jgi:D-serine deaminase-like pyridoxal phosphate-dependent protein